MSLTITRKDRPARKHRAIDRLAQREQELAELQQRLDDADALILRQAIQLGELTEKNGQLARRLRKTEDALINVGKDRDAQERWIKHIEGQLEDAMTVINTRAKAEAVVTRTQEMPVIKPVPLHAAPFATSNPGRIRP